MENLIFDEWIDVGKGTFAKLALSKLRGKENAALITLSFRDEIFPKKKLLVKDRKVFGGSGKIVDFGTAYPTMTKYGKRIITKEFMREWM